MSSDLQPPPSTAAAPSGEVIRIRGARTHNLRNVDLDIPQWRLVVMTGLSGSGKSSLAFDTLLAEGQRQYIESLSTYARQFFDQMERPDVDLIEGLQPTVALDQRTTTNNPRSTVATVTEIYDFLRVLMARTGDVACPNCGTAISQQTPAEIQQAILALPEQSKVMILAPMVRGRKGRHSEILDLVRKEGFVRVRIDGLTYELEDVPELKAQQRHDIDAVVDRVIIRPGIENRLSESVRLALKHGDGALRTATLTPEAKVAANGHANGTASTAENGWEERVFSTRYACPDCKTNLTEIEPRTFSFNSPYGACPACEGLAAREGFVPELVIPDETQSLAAGAVAPWRGAAADARKAQHAFLDAWLTQAKLDWETPLEAWPAKAREQLLTGDGGKFPGLLAHFEMDYAAATNDATLSKLAEFRGPVPCPECGGSRLRAEARSCRLGGLAIHEITALPIDRARQFFGDLKFLPAMQPVGEPLTAEIARRLDFLVEVGVEYLTLDRAADSLSGGEMQRVRLATGIGSGLVGVLYILDEPSIGLHPRDNARLIESLRKLQQQGNTVLVVEHDEALIRAADWLIDVGPGAGDRGGTIVSQGTPAEVAADPDSITGGYLSGRLRIEPPAQRRKPAKTRMLELEGATLHNLQNVDVQIPLGLFTCITGVSGSGKSSLIIDTLGAALARKLNGVLTRPGPYRALRGVAKLERLIHVDQSPIGRTPRSNPATFTGMWDEIRRVFAGTKHAKQHGYKVGRFSFNTKGGRCEHCQGQGVERIEMRFLPDLFVTCPVCHGRQFNRQTLAVRYRDRSIADVLAMPIDEAVSFFENHPSIHRMLTSLVDVGLGYLTLGQRSTTLSGGEAQRIKLAAELGRPSGGPTLYILDEPTTGLHTDDVGRLLRVLQQLVELGHSVLVIEHHLEMIKCADWVIDVGPEGGAAGGQIVVAGTPDDVAACEASYTGRWLRELL
ncbi:excinuclease ABC subunit UvrA [Lacipirellula parvula]|uniref:UvrABC system protein A n=1 Tax=Lacipirellula parvula TaxID=2650471 RepID=A0A5K7XK58_9BACT|nr:excinuclease ABC subunit UvrA [Lacipirellula parvula]BBO36552.1 excinuclease ABC subunit A [Lacipirellula parvula]